MIRNVEPWAASILNVFGSTPSDIIEYLKQAINCAVWLKKNTDCRILRYEDLLRPSVELSAWLTENLGLPFDVAGVSNALAVDLQEGTRLKSKRSAGQGDISARLAEVTRLWRTFAPREQLEFLGLADLAPA